jgi:CheY-like chemotaxis protein
LVNEEDVALLGAINVASKSLLQLINETLDFNKMQMGKLSLAAVQFDVRQLLLEVIQMLSPWVEGEPVQIDMDVRLPEHACIMLDRNRMKQVLLNLATNALKFTEQGSVTLRVEQIKGGIQFSVQDTGRGISEKDQEVLFNRFSQIGETSGVGSGLGLCISRDLVLLMGGSQIKVESRLGRGSIFSFTFPIEHEINVALSSSSSTVIDFEVMHLESYSSNTVHFSRNSSNKSALGSRSNSSSLSSRNSSRNVSSKLTKASFSGSTRHVVEGAAELMTLTKEKAEEDDLMVVVEDFDEYNDDPSLNEGDFLTFEIPVDNSEINVLVVDDTAINLMLACRMLERMGYSVESAENAKDALEKCRSKNFDIVFLDCIMPEMSGQECCKILRTTCGDHYRDCPIVALTATGADKHEALMNAGFTRHVAKPFSKPQLLEAAALGRKQ